MYTNVGWDFYNIWAKHKTSTVNDGLPVLIYFYGIVVFVKVEDTTPYGTITPAPGDKNNFATQPHTIWPKLPPQELCQSIPSKWI